MYVLSAFRHIISFHSMAVHISVLKMGIITFVTYAGLMKTRDVLQ